MKVNELETTTKENTIQIQKDRERYRKKMRERRLEIRKDGSKRTMEITMKKGEKGKKINNCRKRVKCKYKRLWKS